MRIVLTILFFISLKVNATNYYISNAGSDAANGLTPATSWQNISKVNSFSLSPGFAGGDSILFNRGDSWNDTIRISNSGTSGHKIIIAAYGTGNNPILTGFQSVTGMSQSGNLWTKTFTNSVRSDWTPSALNTYAGQNTMFINGALRAKARYPKTGSYYSTTIYSPSGKWIKSEQSLTGTNYVGGELVVRTNNFVDDVVKIIAQDGDTLFYNTALTYNLANRCYFFVQNLASLCTTQNEWSIDSNKLLTIYSTTTPTVKGSTIDTLVNLKNNDYVTFSNIAFEGSNTIGLSYDGSDSITIKNCTFNNNGFNALQGSTSNYTVIKNDSIQNSLNDGIRNFGDSILMQDCYVYNTGYLEGMGGSGNGMCMGFYGGFPGLIVQRNLIRNTGYIGVYFEGTNSLISKNYIDSFDLNKDDGGGIHCYNSNTSGSLIDSNIITNGTGKLWIAAGIYLDAATTGVTIKGNTTNNTRISGIHLNNTGTGNTVRDNTICNTNTTTYGSIAQFGGNGAVSKNNIIYNSDSTINLYWNVGNTSDSNYFLRPIKPASIIQVSNTHYDLAGWQALGQDAHSHTTPSGITSNSPTLYINPTLADSIITLPFRCIDAYGTVYNNSITIHSFQSALLFRSITQPEPIQRNLGNLIFN